MFRLSKGQDPFFAAFAAQAAVAVRASGLLRRLFERPDEREELSKQVTLAEHEGDELTHATIKRLRSVWITPLDRPDIHTLTTQLDDVLDAIDSVAEHLRLFDIRDTPNLALEAARVLDTCVLTVAKAIELLPDARARAQEILDFCQQIGTLEGDADRLYREAIAALFKSGNDAIAIMKWRDIYEQLEAATDLCEDVANTLEGVVLEYA
jgi:predicted phosphate transport protein (TIGR00153 family)